MNFEIDDTVGAWVPHGRFIVPPTRSKSLGGWRFAVKDVFDVAGHPTGAGNPTWLAIHPVAKRHAPVVERLLGAGATLAGKVVTDELVCSLHGENVDYGTPLNTARPDCVPAGPPAALAPPSPRGWWISRWARTRTVPRACPPATPGCGACAPPTAWCRPKAGCHCTPASTR